MFSNLLVGSFLAGDPIKKKSSQNLLCYSHLQLVNSTLNGIMKKEQETYSSLSINYDWSNSRCCHEMTAVSVNRINTFLLPPVKTSPSNFECNISCYFSALQMGNFSQKYKKMYKCMSVILKINVSSTSLMVSIWHPLYFRNSILLSANIYNLLTLFYLIANLCC